MITKEVLLDLIKSAERTKTVLVPSDDYYARDTDFSKEEISYISGTALIEAINEMADVPDED
jgi:hypothetical protein